MNFKQIKRKYFNSSEEVISMFLGLVIVVVVVGLIFNYFQRNKGSVNIPGSSDNITISDESVIGSSGSSYEVLRGDSLWKIAEAKYNNGYAWSEIAKANNLKNPSTLEVGQKLIIPEKVTVSGQEFKLINSVTTETVVQGGDYVVVKGDSLWKIAVRAYGDGYQWTKIWEENKVKLPNANGLEIGMTLTIPKLN